MVLLEELRKKEIDNMASWKKISDDTIVFNTTIKINKYDFEQRVRIMCALTCTPIAQVARKCNTSKVKLLSRCKAGRFKFFEQQELADATGTKVVNEILGDEE